MADKTPGPGTMFGLNEPVQSAPSTPAGAPQVVYVQAPAPGSSPSTGGGMRWLVGLLLALSVANLTLML